MPWEYKKSLTHPRAGLAAATGNAPAPQSGSWVYAIGGSPGGATFAVTTVEAYDPSSNRWSPIAQMPTALNGLAATWSGVDGLHALGGVDAGNKIVATHQIYDPATGAWSPSAKNMPTARSQLAAATGQDGLVYALGGSDGTSFLTTVEAYDPKTKAWNATPIKSMPTPRANLAAVAVDVGPAAGLIYAIGGQNTQGVLNTVEIFVPGLGWDSGVPLPAAITGLAAAVGLDGRVYAIGGIDTNLEPLATVYSIDPGEPRAQGWVPEEPLLTAAGLPAAARGPDGLLYAIGGENLTSTFGTVEAYTKPPPVNACLDLVARLEQRLADGGPKVRVQEYAGFTKELATCYQSRQLTQQQYEYALATLKAINRSSQTPPRG